jgi:glycine cleavage system regulatory protein
MQSSIVLMIIGSDEPGLVEKLSRTIEQHDGNWVESRMTRLAGQFAGVLRVRVPQAQRDALTHAVAELEDQGLRVHVREAEDEAEASPTAAESGLLHLEMIGPDQPGLVHEISEALARREVNVHDLHTECFSAPMSGEPLFRAVADLAVPPRTSEDQLRAVVEEVGSAHALDVTLGHPEDDAVGVDA